MQGVAEREKSEMTISTFKLKTRRELPGTVMGKDARRASGVCVCVCVCVYVCVCVCVCVCV